MKWPKNQSIVKNEMMDKVVHAKIALSCSFMFSSLLPLFLLSLLFLPRSFPTAEDSPLLICLFRWWASGPWLPPRNSKPSHVKCLVVCCSLVLIRFWSVENHQQVSCEIRWSLTIKYIVWPAQKITIRRACWILTAAKIIYISQIFFSEETNS